MGEERASELPWIARVERAGRVLARSRTAGAVLLVTAALLAVVWANSPWGHAYEALLDLPGRVGLGALTLEKPLEAWINDGLMGIFFFVVGLEIKREVLAGDLRTWRRAGLPVAAAIGGMLAPAALFALLNVGGPGARGWGIPMATDIAFALGVLVLLGARVPSALVVFLTAVAIVDDIGAVLVIALFYTDQLSLSSLGLGGALLALSLGFNVLGVRSAVVYFVVGTLVWLAFLQSGVHATIAAVLMAWTIPARPRLDGRRFTARMRELFDRLQAAGVPEGRRLLAHDQHAILVDMERAASEASAPLQRLEHTLLPVASLLVVPVFALANAGVTLGSASLGAALTQPLALGVVLGLFVGKQVGILGCAWLAVRLGLAELPRGVTWRQVHAVGVIGGIGFTMSLFVGSLAFADPALRETAKLATLAGSLLSAAVGVPLLWSATRPAARATAPARGGRREVLAGR